MARLKTRLTASIVAAPGQAERGPHAYEYEDEGPEEGVEAAGEGRGPYAQGHYKVDDGYQEVKGQGANHQVG